LPGLVNGHASLVDANIAHTRQSRPDSGLGFQVKRLEIFKVVPSSLGGASVEGNLLRSLACQALSMVMPPAYVVARFTVVPSIGSVLPRVWDVGLGVWGFGCGVWGVEFRV